MVFHDMILPPYLENYTASKCINVVKQQCIITRSAAHTGQGYSAELPTVSQCLLAEFATKFGQQASVKTRVITAGLKIFIWQSLRS